MTIFDKVYTDWNQYFIVEPEGAKKIGIWT